MFIKRQLKLANPDHDFHDIMTTALIAVYSIRCYIALLVSGVAAPAPRLTTCALLKKFSGAKLWSAEYYCHYWFTLKKFSSARSEEYDALLVSMHS